MGDLSRDFDSSELKCPCCGECNINPALVTALQELRDLIGKPIHVNSGFRCQKHNVEVGGEPDSQHMKGNAADITVQGYSPEQVADLARQIPAFKQGGIGLYDTFTHVDCRTTGKARWDFRSK